jgi:hypothetical protein
VPDRHLDDVVLETKLVKLLANAPAVPAPVGVIQLHPWVRG